MGVKASDIIFAAVGFLLIGILTPIAMGQIVTTSTTSWNSAVITIFQVLLPVIYMIGTALYFIPKMKGD